MFLLKKLFMAVTTCLITSTSAQAFTVSIEEPTVENKTEGDGLVLIDFNNLEINRTSSFSKTGVSNFSTYVYDGNLLIRADNVYGGADNTNYIEPATKGSNFEIRVNKNQKYFGLWWSAGDGSNILTFRKDGEVVATFNTQDVLDTLAELDNESDYYCNPTPVFEGEVCHEPYAFINFFFEGDEEFDEIKLESTSAGGNFESDNHTFSTQAQEVTGVVIRSDSESDPESETTPKGFAD